MTKPLLKSAIQQMCLARSIDIHPTWREAWRRASVAIVSRNTDIHRLCSQTDSWRKSSLPRNISTLEAMLVWTKEKSISLFGCWNAQKSLQRKCHRGSSRGWNAIQLPISKAKSVYVHYTIISRSSTISQTSTSVFISDSDCCPVWKLRPKLPHVQLIQFHRDDFS